MIIDEISRAHRYANLHPLFSQGFDFIQEAMARPFTPGRFHLVDDSLIAIVEDTKGRTRECAPLEAHRKYIDIQYTLEGVEEIGWRAYSACKGHQGPFNVERDIEFFNDTPSIWIPIPSQTFVIFFPREDAHAPLAGRDPVRKIILKVAI